eukprot:9448947-Karenia_brevis.AAC.1
MSQKVLTHQLPEFAVHASAYFKFALTPESQRMFLSSQLPPCRLSHYGYTNRPTHTRLYIQLHPQARIVLSN